MAHYRRWQRTGDVRAADPIKAFRSRCSVLECENSHYGHGLCQKHYYRWQRHGDPEADLRRAVGDGSITTNGYLRITRHNHPLASTNGAVSEHRVVLFDAIGPGEHSCHWCGATITWDVRRGSWERVLVADHLDGDKLNNAVENLVPSCLACNASRRYVTCENCGHKQRY